jgi:DNA-binding MarR family transcriptional regulator
MSTPPKSDSAILVVLAAVERLRAGNEKHRIPSKRILEHLAPAFAESPVRARLAVAVDKGWLRRLRQDGKAHYSYILTDSGSSALRNGEGEVQQTPRHPGQERHDRVPLLKAIMSLSERGKRTTFKSINQVLQVPGYVVRDAARSATAAGYTERRISEQDGLLELTLTAAGRALLDKHLAGSSKDTHPALEGDTVVAQMSRTIERLLDEIDSYKEEVKQLRQFKPAPPPELNPRVAKALAVYGR